MINSCLSLFIVIPLQSDVKFWLCPRRKSRILKLSYFCLSIDSRLNTQSNKSHLLLHSRLGLNELYNLNEKEARHLIQTGLLYALLCFSVLRDEKASGLSQIAFYVALTSSGLYRMVKAQTNCFRDTAGSRLYMA